MDGEHMKRLSAERDRLLKAGDVAGAGLAQKELADAFAQVIERELATFRSFDRLPASESKYLRQLIGETVKAAHAGIAGMNLLQAQMKLMEAEMDRLRWRLDAKQ